MDDDDPTLLRRFLTTRDSAAFAALVRRHVDLVYSAARRQVRDDAAAQDVTQQVFVLLADKARTVRDGEALAGWLLVTTRYVALNAQRADARRRRHEREAAVMQEQRRTNDGPAWDQVAPMLDAVVAKLKREDRDALALRYFQGRSVADVAAALGVSHDAAQKRLTRAIHRLRDHFAGRGVTTSAEALSSVLMANAVVVAPAALGQSVAATALAAAVAGAVGGTGAGISAKGAFSIMAVAKTKLAAASVAAVVLVGVTGTLAYQQLRTPGGKSRQVRVDPAAAALPAVPPRQTVDANGPWRQRFNAVYMLAPGEALKRVEPPFIPERLDFYLATVGGAQAEAIPRGADAIVLTHDATGVRGRRWLFGGSFDVNDVLRNVVEVSPQEVDLPPDVKNLDLPGDVVYRPEATPEQRMAAFARVLSSATGRPYEMVRQTRECEAIVITGAFAFRPLPGVTQERGRTVYLHLTAPPTTRPSLSHVGDGFKALLENLGNLTGLPVVAEATLPQRGAPNVKIDPSLFAYMNGRKAMDAATVDLLLANVAKQTSLVLKREPRVMPMWVPAGAASTQAAPTQAAPTQPATTQAAAAQPPPG